MFAPSESRKAAVFIDFENVASARDDLISHVLAIVCTEATIVMRRAYGDWGRLAKAKHRLMHQGVELIELPASSSGKNRADMKLTVDAMETAFTKPYIGTFVVVSGDSDFISLSAKLQELDREVWLFASESNTSRLLESYCSRLTLLPATPRMATPQVPPDSPSPELLGEVYWAILLCVEGAGDNEHPLDLMVSAFRSLNPEFQLQDHMGPRKRPRYRLASRLQELGLIRLRYDAPMNQYYFAPGDRLNELVGLSTRPENFLEMVEQMQLRHSQKTWLEHLPLSV